MRTLNEMKKSRGGHCFNCKVNIMGDDQLDHTFCNDCWNKLMAHPYREYIDMEGEVGCDICDEPKNSRTHI